MFPAGLPIPQPLQDFASANSVSVILKAYFVTAQIAKFKEMGVFKELRSFAESFAHNETKRM